MFSSLFVCLIAEKFKKNPRLFAKGGVALLCLLLTANATMGKTVDQKTAQTIAYNFFKPKAAIQSPSELSVIFTGTSDVNGANVTGFYVFNWTAGNGYVIVSADDAVMPILGYSTESNFPSANLNSSLLYVLNSYENQIAYAIANGATGSANTAAEWANLQSGNATLHGAGLRTTASSYVRPLLPTTWNQENPSGSLLTYNADCPYDAAQGAQTITGCVATAMAQVMKYWNWPDTGVGHNSYTQYPNPDGIPVQTANFDIAFHFDSMQTPNVTSANPYVARLMYYAGVSVNMNYGTDAEGGSSAYVTSASSPIANCAEYALKTYFRYPTEKGYQRRNFTDAEWLDTMLNEVNSSRPVIYSGSGDSGGHCWVMDGYDDDTFFHFNWGWSGYADGYFTLNNLDPDGLTFDDYNEAIIRIIPDTPTVDTVRAAVATVQPAENNVLIYPNPASNMINVSLGGLTASQATVIDAEGNILLKQAVAANNHNLALQVNELPDGIYLLQLQTGQGIITRKFVIAR